MALLLLAPENTDTRAELAPWGLPGPPPQSGKARMLIHNVLGRLPLRAASLDPVSCDAHRSTMAHLPGPHVS
jgi:hypothetical protein